MAERPDPIFRLAAAGGLLVASGTALLLLPAGTDLAHLAIQSALALGLLFGAIYSGFSAWQWSQMPAEEPLPTGAGIEIETVEAALPREDGVLHYDKDHATATPVYRPE